MRTHYANGEEIGLKECGCDGCSPTMINGVLCHETGCPYAYKDKTVECFYCGRDFHPTHSSDRQCSGCKQEELEFDGGLDLYDDQESEEPAL